ncbi:MAG: methyltransferase [Chloroflexota bacterium]|nr:MAG: methyltransferase [Chloroflexota bacterium]
MAKPPMTAPAPDTAAALRKMIMGFRTTQLLSVAARLNLADLLAQGPRPARELARETGAEPAALYRLLRALASTGVLAETDDGQFGLTELGMGLCRERPGSAHSLAVLFGEPWLWQAYARLDYSVATGQPAFNHVHGMPLYGYLAQHPEAAAVFHAAMSGFSNQEVSAILNAYDFTGTRRLVDVGGGQGALLAGILKAYPALQGVLFDRPEVIAQARAELTAGPLEARCQLVAGDFFRELPAGGDVYLLKSVLHNWDDARSALILRRCRAGMERGGRVLAAERVIPPGTGPAEGKLFDINMLVMQGGRERTEREYAALFSAAGFRLRRVVPTSSPLSIVEGVAL